MQCCAVPVQYSALLGSVLQGRAVRCGAVQYKRDCTVGGQPPCIQRIPACRGCQFPPHPALLLTFFSGIPCTCLQVYSGGLGSYALLVMVAAFLQLHPSRQQSGTGCRRSSQLACISAHKISHADHVLCLHSNSITQSPPLCCDRAVRQPARPATAAARRRRRRPVSWRAAWGCCSWTLCASTAGR